MSVLKTRELRCELVKKRKKRSALLTMLLMENPLNCFGSFRSQFYNNLQQLMKLLF